jgi:hypothetical protein
MQVSARVIKPTIILRRAVSDPSAAVKSISFNPENVEQPKPVQSPTLQILASEPVK